MTPGGTADRPLRQDSERTLLASPAEGNLLPVGLTDGGGEKGVRHTAGRIPGTRGRVKVLKR